MAKRASTILALTPFFLKFSSAIKHSFNLAPKFKIAIFFPSLTTFAFPIWILSLISGNLTPVPFPLGYLNAHGLSLISTDVFIIFTNSASSLAAITIKFGRVAKYVISKDPACVGPSAPTRPALSIANLTGKL